MEVIKLINYLIAVIFCICYSYQIFYLVMPFLKRNSYLMMYVLGLITTITEWKQIHTTTKKKILYTFTFPFFMMTYIPISFAAFFKKVEWKPIEHTQGKTLDEVMSVNKKNKRVTE